MDKPKVLTKEQIQRQDFVDNEIHWMLTELAKDITGTHIWNIEDIAKIREVAMEILYEWDSRMLHRDEFEMEFYPYIEEE